MKSFKFQLLAAAALIAPAMPAHAQFKFPDAEIDGVGASAPADVTVKVLNCIGVNSNLGVNNSASLTTVTNADYANTGTPSNGKPSLTCSVDDVNGNIYNAVTPSNFIGHYVSTGSGFGRQQWRNFANNFLGTSSSQNPFGPWTNVQFAFSEAPATPADITDYNNDDTELATVNGVPNTDIDVSAAANAGAPIQFPLFVIPVAFAYNPVYGNNNGADMAFNVQNAQTTNGVAAGGLRLTKAVYCGIWNGTITNWNDPAIEALNKNGTVATPLYDTANDTAGRWTSEGAPIRLVGRADNSGTTDIFTRALSTQCSGTKFLRSAEALPFSPGTSPIDIRGLRSSSPYFPGSTAIFAGTTTSLNGIVYDRTNNRFCRSTEAASAACSATPAAITIADYQVGGFARGLFLVADGSSSVEAAVRRNDGINAALASTVTPGVTLNGKLGYIGADFVAGSTGRTLHAAALAQGTSTSTFLMPNSKNASTAFGKVLPPQSTLSSGVYNPADARVVYKDLTNLGAGTEAISRSNPLHWVNALYPPTGATLANPATGYPVTGASNFLTYTCFNSEGKRAAIANFIGHLFGNIKKKNAAGGTPTSISLSAKTFNGLVAPEVGILTKSNVALPSSGWLKAITETFLKGNSTQPGLSALNLWIQSAQATSASTFTAVTSNPSCAVDGAGTIPGA